MDVAPPARPGTPSTLAARRLRLPGHHGMEEVRGSSPLSSTAKVLVKAHLIFERRIVVLHNRGASGVNGRRSASISHPLVIIRGRRRYFRLHWFHLLWMLARQVLGAVRNDQEDRHHAPQR